MHHQVVCWNGKAFNTKENDTVDGGSGSGSGSSGDHI